MCNMAGLPLLFVYMSFSCYCGTTNLSPVSILQKKFIFLCNNIDKSFMCPSRTIQYAVVALLKSTIIQSCDMDLAGGCSKKLLFLLQVLTFGCQSLLLCILLTPQVAGQTQTVILFSYVTKKTKTQLQL